MSRTNTRSGFTIVELLIVVVVIAILAAITIVSFNGIQQRAKLSAARSDLASLSKAITIAQTIQNKTLLEIINIPETYTFGNRAATNQALDAISAASEVNLDSLKKGDPWGGFYEIDANEGEIANDKCRQDLIRASSSKPGESPQTFYDTTTFIPLSIEGC
jgi:prepilin-type N-terminal cleavage/methylation domain-containing protein